MSCHDGKRRMHHPALGDFSRRGSMCLAMIELPGGDEATLRIPAQSSDDLDKVAKVINAARDGLDDLRDQIAGPAFQLYRSTLDQQIAEEDLDAEDLSEHPTVSSADAIWDILVVEQLRLSIEDSNWVLNLVLDVDWPNAYGLVARFADNRLESVALEGI